jgi:DNA-binding NarL/FixJ family response regulator
MKITNIKLLLVEDHKILRECISAAINKKFPHVKILGETNNAQSSITLTAKLSPQIVIMDISLPGMNGIEATRKIVSRNPDIKVIILSMHKEKEFVIKALEAGAKGYLLKECDMDELGKAIETVIKNKYYLSPSISGAMIETVINNLPETVNAYRCLLTPKERDIVRFYADGKSTKEIALLLKISNKTVETHRMRIMNKLNIRTIAELTKYAIREGLTSL